MGARTRYRAAFSHKEAYAICRAQEKTGSLPECCSGIGLAAMMTGGIDEGVARFQEAIRWAEACGDESEKAWNLQCMAEALIREEQAA